MKKIAVVTGGSKGIGAEIVTHFATNGYTVCYTYNNSLNQAEILTEKIIKLGFNAKHYKCNINNSNEVDNFINSVINEYKTIDVLINNAGISHEGLFTDTTETDWNNLIETNIKGILRTTNKILPLMIKNHTGKIINISSMWGQVGASCEVLYSMTKSAVIGFTKALAKEVGPSCINVNCICPGVIKTDMLDCYTKEDLKCLEDETPLCRLGTPNDIAKTALFLASKNSNFITGQIIGVNGGFVI